MRILVVELRVTHFIGALVLCLFSALALPADVGLAGVMGSKALITVDGGAPQVVAVGQSVGGARLLAVESDHVMVEIDGKKRALRVGQHAAGAPPAAAAGAGDRVVLISDSRGHFVTNGAINGVSVRFMVDTGATFVSMGASDARRAGVDVTQGRRGMSQTANGVTVISLVKLDSVRVGDVTLYNVDAAVHQGEMPVVLLGMSFLNRMEMHRDGSAMTLKKRF